MHNSHTVSAATAAPVNGLRSSHWVTIFVSVLLVICALIFLANREQDIGNVGIFVRQFGVHFMAGHLVNGHALLAGLAATGIAGLVALSWIGLGGILLRWQANPAVENFALRLCWRAGIGAALWSLIWFALGTLHLYQRPIALGFLCLGLISFGWETRFIYKEFSAARQSGDSFEKREKILLALIGLPLVLAYVASLAPVTGKDALVYRLAVPQAYLQAGGLVDVPNNVYSYLSFGAEMHGVWAMLLAQFFNPQIAEQSFGLIGFSFFALLLAAVYGIAREWQLPRHWALLAALLVGCIPSLYQVASTGYVDHTLALFILLAAFAVGRWWVEPGKAPLILLALALGGAFAVKFIALFGFFAIAFIVLLKVRTQQQENNPAVLSFFINGSAALLGGGLLASPWYLRLWLRTGSPLVPFYAHLWDGKMVGWDAERSRLFQFWVSQYGGAEKNLLDYAGAILKISLWAQPENAALFDGVIGISLLVGLPLLFLALKQKQLSAPSKIMAGIAGAWFFLWLFTSQQLRFLLPSLPLILLAIVAGAVKNAPEKARVLQWILVASALPGLLVIASWFLEQNPVAVALGSESREAYLARRIEFYPYYQVINQTLPKDAKVWLINMRNDTVHLQRAYEADYIFEDYTLTEMVKASADLTQLRGKIKALGVTHMMMRHDVLLDYARTPVVDERKSEAENQQKFALLQQLLAQGTTVLKRDEKYLLLAL